ncbi:MAG TPA: hypothetical protein PK970_12890 [Hyphomicrobiaceae bacterium]|nr:hypothetical protein [Hyphomicrobiaceae bacterium]
MTSIPKVLTSLVVAGSMLAGQAVVFSSDASAREWRHRGESHRFHKPYSRHYVPRHVTPRHYEPRYSYGHRYQRRDRTGDAVAATILGLGAVIIGSAIANAHKNRRDHRSYDEYDD